VIMGKRESSQESRVTGRMERGTNPWRKRPHDVNGRGHDRVRMEEQAPTCLNFGKTGLRKPVRAEGRKRKESQIPPPPPHPGKHPPGPKKNTPPKKTPPPDTPPPTHPGPPQTNEETPQDNSYCACKGGKGRGGGIRRKENSEEVVDKTFPQKERRGADFCMIGGIIQEAPSRESGKLMF